MPLSLSGTRSCHKYAAMSLYYWLLSVIVVQKHNLALVKSCARMYLLTCDISDQIFPIKVLKLLTELDIYR